MNINRDIIRLAIPAIFTNITIPLLGLVDISIAGHLNNSTFIGAIAIGSMMFNLLYWNFSFLRMGTTGMTAQQYGKDDVSGTSVILFRAMAIAVSVGLLILLLQFPLKSLILWILSPSDIVATYAIKYFDICVWGAPAFLSIIVLKGWLLGVQNAKYPMIIAISINIMNILFSLISVFVLKIGFIGIALGTLLSQYMGLIIAVLLIIYKYRVSIHFPNVSVLLKGDGLRRFFRINSDIFLRSFCLLCVNLAFTAIGARAGDLILAVNAIIMQLFFFYSYFMDGFAYAGEAIVGKYKGAGNVESLRKTVSLLFVWGVGVAITFAVIYSGFMDFIVRLLTDDEAIFQEILNNKLWCILIPFVGVGAFIWDGIFVGLTATRQMVASTFIAAAVFFSTYYIAYSGFSYNRLWLSFILFLMVRAIVLTLFYNLDKRIFKMAH